MSRATSRAEERAAAAAPLFAALGDATRLRVLARLSHKGPVSLRDLAANQEVTRQAIAKHVGVLETAGLVRTRREGRERVCELRPERIEEAHAHLSQIAAQWDDALGRLATFLQGSDADER